MSCASLRQAGLSVLLVLELCFCLCSDIVDNNGKDPPVIRRCQTSCYTQTNCDKHLWIIYTETHHMGPPSSQRATKQNLIHFQALISEHFL